MSSCLKNLIPRNIHMDENSKALLSQIRPHRLDTYRKIEKDQFRPPNDLWG